MIDRRFHYCIAIASTLAITLLFAVPIIADTATLLFQNQWIAWIAFACAVSILFSIVTLIFIWSFRKFPRAYIIGFGIIAALASAEKTVFFPFPTWPFTLAILMSSLIAALALFSKWSKIPICILAAFGMASAVISHIVSWDLLLSYGGFRIDHRCPALTATLKPLLTRDEIIKATGSKILFPYDIEIDMQNRVIVATLRQPPMLGDVSVTGALALFSLDDDRLLDMFVYRGEWSFPQRFVLIPKYQSLLINHNCHFIERFSYQDGKLKRIAKKDLGYESQGCTGSANNLAFMTCRNKLLIIDPETLSVKAEKAGVNEVDYCAVLPNDNVVVGPNIFHISSNPTLFSQINGGWCTLFVPDVGLFAAPPIGREILFNNTQLKLISKIQLGPIPRKMVWQKSRQILYAVRFGDHKLMAIEPGKTSQSQWTFGTMRTVLNQPQIRGIALAENPDRIYLCCGCGIFCISL